ncbi:MAG: hypothetical protein WAO91_05275 [Candidatus Nitrosotenuis sp.]
MKEKISDTKKAALLSVPLAIISIMFVYLVWMNPTAMSQNASIYTVDEIGYIKTVNNTLAGIGSVIDDTEDLGAGLILSGKSVEDVITELRGIEEMAALRKKQIEETAAPQRFAEAHQHLVAALDRNTISLRLLVQTFEEFQQINGGKIPLFLVSNLLGTDEKTQLPALYSMLLMNKDEQERIKNARLLFNNSLLEKALMEEEMTKFEETAGIDLDVVSYIQSNASLYFASSGGCAACSLSIEELRNSTRIR